MRSARPLIALLALALAASLGLAPAGAQASVARGAAVSGADRADLGSVSGRTDARLATTVTAKVVKKRVRPNGPRVLVIKGAVSPLGVGPVKIQRATKCNKATKTCNFKFYRKKALKNGRYEVVIDAPNRLRGWVWRAKVGSALSNAWLTCRKRPTQECKIPY
ncbi:hypothetical protein [Nocardioides litoris]|uniref:hypothetical protein n=1 Tax=Nocardioides litoris TaxID=1926648 RepID=UPI001477242A|nr:hypothetical protein [Nocardioides litoris]